MAPSVRNAQMSLAQITIDHMRRQETLYTLTGDGELDERDLKVEWQHKLKTSPSWQEKTNGMTDHKKKNFLRHKHDAFIAGIRKAFAHAQAKLGSGRLAPADTDGKNSASPRPEEEGGEVTDTLPELHHDRLRELDESQQELPEETPRVLKTVSLSQKEYEALALATFQRNRMHRDNPNAVLSKEKYEAQTLASVTEERTQQSEGFQEMVRYKESQRRKKAERKIKLKAFDARRRKSNAKMAEFKSKKQARKDSKEAAKEQKREALEAEKQAKANVPLQEELAQQHKEAKKKRKRAALEANPHAKGDREQSIFGFRYFPNEKARARAQKELMDIEAPEKRTAALDDTSTSSVWQAVKSFGTYMFNLSNPVVDVKPTHTCVD